MDWVAGHPTIEDMVALEHNEFVPLWINSGPMGKQTKTLVMAKWDGPRNGFRIQGYTMGQYLQPGEYWCRLPVSPESCRGVIGSREK